MNDRKVITFIIEDTQNNKSPMCGLLKTKRR